MDTRRTERDTEKARLEPKESKTTFLRWITGMFVQIPMPNQKEKQKSP